MSIPSIEHNKNRNLVIRIIEKFNHKEVFIIFGGILIMIASVFMVSFFSKPQENTQNVAIWSIDIPISLLVAFALLQELNKAFSNRGMKFMYLPTFLLFLLIVIAVTHRIIPFEFAQEWMDIAIWNSIGTISSLSFKFLFIILFTILLYSWKLLAEKEEQQVAFVKLKARNTLLEDEIGTLEIANESHLRTIKNLKKDLAKEKQKFKTLEKASVVELSARQKEVLGNLVFSGTTKSYTEIADAMNISVDGFQTHIYQIKKALNISGTDGKEQLINYGIANRLVEFATINYD